MPTDTTTQLVLAGELAVMAAGLAALWRWHLRKKAREATRHPLGLWPIQLVDLATFLALVFAGAVLAGIGTGILFNVVTLSEATRQVLAGAGFQLGMLGGCLVFQVLHGPTHGYARPRRGFIGAGFVTFLISIPLLALTGLAWLALLDWLHVPYERQSLVDLFANAESRWQLGALLVLATVIAPITEELVFRAGLFQFLHKRTPRWVALLIPALLFGASHTNLASFPQLVLLGVIFSIAYERTGNIAVPMFAHALFNLHSIAIVLTGVDL